MRALAHDVPSVHSKGEGRGEGGVEGTQEAWEKRREGEREREKEVAMRESELQQLDCEEVDAWLKPTLKEISMCMFVCVCV